MIKNNYFSFYGLVLLAVGAVLASYTSVQNSHKISVEWNDLELLAENMDSLRHEIEKNYKKLEKKVKKLNDKVVNLELENIIHDLKHPNSTRCILNAKKIGGYLPVISKSKSAIFYISVKNVVPYFNGYEITLNIGNPMSATYDNPQLSIKWETEEKKRKDQVINLCGKISAGSWHSVKFILSSITEKELEKLKISFHTNQVLLTDRLAIPVTSTSE